MSRHKELVHPKCLDTLENIRALKKAEQAAIKQKEARELREGVKNLVWLALGAVLLYFILSVPLFL